MRIWIDISTPAQVLYMRPILAVLGDRGHSVITTTRRATDTIPLANHYGLEHEPIGVHGGGTLIGKAVAIAMRALQLAGFMAGRDIDIAFSHSSYSQVLAATILRIPTVVTQDYEGNPGNHLLCRLADKILVSEHFSQENLYRYGARPSSFDTFSGLKEHIYLSTFEPLPSFLEKSGIPADGILVTMRSPNLAATYHRFENPLFDQIADHVLSSPSTRIVFLPRGAEQRQEYRDRYDGRIFIPAKVLDGPNLVFHSDLVIGAGGTMNREAVVLGTPAYTVFKGELGSVDRYLIHEGKMTRISDIDDLPKIRLHKKSTANRVWRQGPDLVAELVDKILLAPRAYSGG